jgi:molybdopterin-guanine dinucleotide biosynthesis protein A
LKNLRGLVLTGGKSSRMGTPKAELNYHGEPEYERCLKLLRQVCDEVYLSVSDNWAPPQSDDTKTLHDGESAGPLSGVMAAFQKHPDAVWIVLACDLPFFDENALRALVAARDPAFQATCFVGHQSRPEPLCAIYEPSAASAIAAALAEGRRCARHLLESLQSIRLTPENPNWVRNVNERGEFEQLLSSPFEKGGRGDFTSSNHEKIPPPPFPKGEFIREALTIEIQYVAQLREAACISTERITTAHTTPRALYDDLSRKYGFLLRPQHMRVAVNDEMTSWDQPLNDNDRLLFLPPVAGG